jgi:O-acetyl-ADP-ribose deacetylase (regulator of RNase III)
LFQIHLKAPILDRLSTPITFDIISADLTQLTLVDAVVSSVNNRLKHGSGVAKIISMLAGSDYKNGCDSLLESRGKVPLPLGSAHLVKAGKLMNQNVKFIINACAMGYTAHNHVMPATQKTLSSALTASLVEANNAGCQNILIPLMCASNGGLTAADSAWWTVKAVHKWAAHNPGGTLKKVYLNAYNFRSLQEWDFKNEWQDAMAKAL